MNAPKEYEIEGAEIVDYFVEEGFLFKYPFRYEYVIYKANKVKIAIAKDMFGIDICSEGFFCRQPKFKSMLDAIKYLKHNLDYIVDFYKGIERKLKNGKKCDSKQEYKKTSIKMV